MIAKRGGHAIDHLLAIFVGRTGPLCAACDGEDRQGMPPRRDVGLTG